MKINCKYFPDGWHWFKRTYKDQSILEKHLIQFCTTLLENMPEKSTYKLMRLINQEICRFLKTHKGKMGNMSIRKIPMGSIVGNPEKRSYGVVLVRPGRFPFFEISEPMP